MTFLKKFEAIPIAVFDQASFIVVAVGTYQNAVEELVNTEAQDTHQQVDDMVHKLKIRQHLPWLLGECTLVAHHTYQIYTFVYHLFERNKWTLQQQYM